MKTLIFILSLFAISMVSCSEDEVVDQPVLPEDPVLPEKPFLTIENLPADSTFYFTNKEETKQISIKSNVNWKVESKGETVEWCADSSNIEEDKLIFSVTVNDELKTRTCHYLLTADSVSSIQITISQLGAEPVLQVVYDDKTIAAAGDEIGFEVVSNIDYEISTKASWLTQVKTNNTKATVSTAYKYEVAESWASGMRTGTIYVKPIDESLIELREIIIVKQDPVEYESIFPEDKLVPIASAVLSRGNTYSTQSVELTYDKNISTIYSSSGTTIGDSVIIDYTLDGTPALINSIHLIQRQDGNSHSFFEAGSMWFQDKNSSDWELAKVFKGTRGSNVTESVNMLNPVKVRICLKNITAGGAIALAETEFYELEDRGDLENDAHFFEDDMFSQLKSSTTEADINKMTSPIVQFLARELLADKYTNKFRARTYKGQRTPWTVSSELKFGSQSHYDNPTGIFFSAGEKCTVFLGKGAGASVNLRITDFRSGGGSEDINLQEGINLFTPKVSGGGFIQYYTDNASAESLPDINVHFAFGHEMGFWDTRLGHTNADWKEMLDMAAKCHRDLNHSNGFFTTCGEKSQLLNIVSAFKAHCPDDIERLMIRHDSILILSYDLMGLTKNVAVPVNRKLNRRTWGGAPNWGGSSANLPNDERGMLDADHIGWWLYAHELGHGNQIKPHMHMAGWGETTNNIYSAYVQYMMGDRKNLRLDHENISRKQGDNEPATIGGRFNAYLNEAHVELEPYLTQEGPDYDKGSMNGQGLRGDHFVKLAPLWQLTLYFMLIEGAEWECPDFWADILWKATQDDRTNLSNGERYVNFMKNCMISSNSNLTKFFTDMGLLRVVDRYIDDYAVGKVTITQADVDEITAFGARFSDPNSPVISYISVNSLNAFKNKAEVEGTHAQGVSNYTDGGRKGKKVEHSTWRNVVVFETYAGVDLVDVAMVGTGNLGNTWTYVRYPDGATRIEAVSYSGQRTLVYGEKK